MLRKLETVGAAVELCLHDFEQRMLNIHSSCVAEGVVLNQYKRIMIVLVIFASALLYHDLNIQPVQTMTLIVTIIFLFIQRKHIAIAWTKEHSDNTGGEV